MNNIMQVNHFQAQEPTPPVPEGWSGGMQIGAQEGFYSETPSHRKLNNQALTTESIKFFLFY